MSGIGFGIGIGSGTGTGTDGVDIPDLADALEAIAHFLASRASRTDFSITRISSTLAVHIGEAVLADALGISAEGASRTRRVTSGKATASILHISQAIFALPI